MQPVTGLSYEQGPPLGVPLGFFQSATLFLLLAALAGLLASLWPDSLTSRWSPAVLAITHLLTLGFLGLVMVGAMLQMLPVLLGVTVKVRPFWAQAARHGLSAGTLLLALGLGLGDRILLIGAATMLGLSLLSLLPGFTRALFFSRARTSLTWPYRKAWLALWVTFILGLSLALGLAGLWPLADPIGLTHLHLIWGLAGWVLLLIIASAYQVIPMLQLTPPYPARVSRSLTWLLFTGLLLDSLGASTMGAVILAMTALIFSLSTLWIQHRRRRKVVDETMSFWRLGMVSLALCALLLPVTGQLTESLVDPAQTSLGILFLIGFASSVVMGMLYKILPFLAWFHLRTQTGAPSSQIPNMKQFIPDRQQRQHFWLHLLSVVLLLPMPFLPGPFALLGWAFLTLSAFQLLRHIDAVKRSFLAHGGRL
jgi:hypothetical protein